VFPLHWQASYEQDQFCGESEGKEGCKEYANISFQVDALLKDWLRNAFRWKRGVDSLEMLGITGLMKDLDIAV